MKYFIDTSFWIAYSYERDKYHQDSLKIMKEIEGNKSSILYTSDYVIDEFLNLTIKLTSIKQAINWGKIIFDENFVHILYTNQVIINLAWDIFQKEENERKPLNLTDCIVYVGKKSLNCDVLLTYDERLKNY